MTAPRHRARSDGSGTALRALGLLTGLTAAMLTGPGAQAQSDSLPQRLACAFDEGSAATYGGGAFKRSTPAALSFEITGIDLARQNAALKPGGDRAPGELRIVRALNANHFLEVAAEGFLNLTTVYDPDPKTGLFPAVHSRHFGLFGEAVVAQYTGTCKAVEAP